jgi:hypothetical protein
MRGRPLRHRGINPSSKLHSAANEVQVELEARETLWEIAPGRAVTA